MISTGSEYSHAYPVNSKRVYSQQENAFCKFAFVIINLYFQSAQTPSTKQSSSCSENMACQDCGPIEFAHLAATDVNTRPGTYLLTETIQIRCKKMQLTYGARQTGLAVYCSSAAKLDVHVEMFNEKSHCVKVVQWWCH